MIHRNQTPSVGLTVFLLILFMLAVAWGIEWCEAIGWIEPPVINERAEQ